MIIETITKINFTRKGVLENLDMWKREWLIRFSNATGIKGLDLALLCTDQYELRKQMKANNIEWVITPKTDDDFISLLKNRFRICVNNDQNSAILLATVQSTSFSFSFEWQTMSPPDMTK